MKATRELGEVRITVCRSRLASDRGEMESARFLVNLTALRGRGKSGAGAGNRRYGQGTRLLAKRGHLTVLCPSVTS